MGPYIAFILLFYNLLAFGQLPDGFVYVQEIIPDLKVELRYFSSNNFVGSKIDGYKTNKLILTKATVEKLKLVQEELEKQHLCLLIFDGYRPQRAVNHFMAWAANLNDTINKLYYYPEVKKKDLIGEYIASRSGHSRGSTVDLTIFDQTTNLPLDMGSSYDFFGKQSWTDYNGITEKQKANRKLLLKVMQNYGFVNLKEEWWHYSLKDEPFPDMYFDFVIE